ncbi:hypothetical protein C0992_007741 [Termitomyces sp. T32_za158]|nr:hypothetical protein C0992_007741 [Termitomyces sp. T32_za158]
MVLHAMDNLTELFAKTPPGYQWPAKFCATVTVVVWIASLITSNVSQVDRLWTFLPFIYAGYYALLPLWPQEPSFFLCPYTPKNLGWTIARDFSPRAVLMLGLVFLWMIRHDEDYRWAILRDKVPAWFFQVINLTFIAATQNVLLLLLSFPIKTASTFQPHTPLATSDYVLAVLALVDLAFEFTADNQQWAFHQYKHAHLAAEKGTSEVEPYDKRKQWFGARLDFTPSDAKRGFVTRGLWAYSRHPNFLCEQSFWWIITLFPLLSSSKPDLISTSFPWHLIPTFSDILQNFPDTFYPLLSHLCRPLSDLAPAFALSLLFFSSTLFTESISVGKYPKEYKAYQERVGMFSPLRTWEKGLVLGWRGRKKEADDIIWGEGNKEKSE